MYVHARVPEVLLRSIYTQQVYCIMDREVYCVHHGFGCSECLSKKGRNTISLSNMALSAILSLLTPSLTTSSLGAVYLFLALEFCGRFMRYVVVGNYTSTGSEAFNPHTKPSQPLRGCVIKCSESKGSPSYSVRGSKYTCIFFFGGELSACNLPSTSEQQGPNKFITMDEPIFGVHQDYF